MDNQPKHSTHCQATAHSRSSLSCAATVVLLVTTMFPLMRPAQAQQSSATSITLQGAISGPDSQPLHKDPSALANSLPAAVSTSGLTGGFGTTRDRVARLRADALTMDRDTSDRTGTHLNPHLLSKAVHLIPADRSPAADNNVRRSLATTYAREPVPPSLACLADGAEAGRLGTLASWSAAGECGARARCLAPAARSSRWLFGPLAALLAALGIGTHRRQ